MYIERDIGYLDQKLQMLQHINHRKGHGFIFC